MVTYGRHSAGAAVGAVCGRRELMKRSARTGRADICFARGTFNSHPYVMGAMCEFLERLQTPQMQAKYAGLDERWNARARLLNERLRAAGLPVQVTNLSPSGLSATCSRRATTGCFNIICAPQGWR